MMGSSTIGRPFTAAGLADHVGPMEVDAMRVALSRDPEGAGAWLAEVVADALVAHDRRDYAGVGASLRTLAAAVAAGPMVVAT